MQTSNKTTKKPGVKEVRIPNVVQERIVAQISRGCITTKEIVDWDVINSDDFIDALCATYKDEIEQCVKKSPTAEKTERIRNWQNRILKMRDLIRQTRKDRALSDFTKAKSITHYVGIIIGDLGSIRDALEYMKRRDSRDREFTARLQKTR